MSLGSLFGSIMKWILIGLVVLFCLPFLYMGTSYVYRLFHTYTHAYRLTVEVETPHGIVCGSSVVRVTYIRHMANWNPSASALTSKVEGDAIFLDLGDGKNLVVTLAFGPTGTNVDRLARLAAIAFGHYQGRFYEETQQWNGHAALNGELIPTLVTFRNLSDPSTLKVVKPDDIPKSFGLGYSFRRAYVEITNDDPCKTIDKKLSWVGDYAAERIAEQKMRAADNGLGPSGTPGMKFRRGQ